MGAPINHTGTTFGNLTVLALAEHRQNRRRTWLCRCSCGNTVFVLAASLTSGRTRSCGCLRSPDLTGQTFGKLTALFRTKVKGRCETFWHCSCACGNDTLVRMSSLIKGDTNSCGCLTGCTTLRHGHARKGKKTATYQTWSHLMNRCNPDSVCKDSAKYGKLGILVCDRWLVYENFLEDMGEKPPGMSLDRLDNALGYSKDNCRWATAKQQAQNRTNNVNITYNGETLCISEWARRLGCTDWALRARINNGWDVHRAFTQPFRKHKGWKLNSTPLDVRKASRDFSRRYTHLRRPGDDLTFEDWCVICRNYDNKCVYCGLKKKLTVDHVVPLSKGGAHTASNVVPACSTCNASKGARLKKDALYTFNGETLVLFEWAKRLGKDIQQLQYRLNHGWPVTKAFTEPSRRERYLIKKVSPP